MAQAPDRLALRLADRAHGIEQPALLAGVFQEPGKALGQQFFRPRAGRFDAKQPGRIDVPGNRYPVQVHPAQLRGPA